MTNWGRVLMQSRRVLTAMNADVTCIALGTGRLGRAIRYLIGFTPIKPIIPSPSAPPMRK